jgi:CRISPR/Cas system-associated endoribonuclease Cas2
MRGDVKYSILQILNDFAGDAVDMGIAFLKSGYGASLSEIQRNYLLQGEVRHQNKKASEEIRELKNRFYSIANSLKRDKLLETKTQGDRLLLEITGRGIKKHKEMQLKRKVRMGLSPSPENQAGKKVVIVAFDIPEKDRWKRHWIRMALLNMGMRHIQKSVWIGKVLIPKDFLERLETLKLIEYVEIFSIDKFGTLDELLI